MRRAPLLFGVLAWAAGAAQAHDFWLQPVRWQPAGNAPLDLTLQVGHGKDRQRSPISASRVTLAEAVRPDGSTIDLRSSLHLGDRTSDLSAGNSADVPAMIAFATDANAQSHLDSDRFNHHLADEGLIAASAWRSERKLSAAEGSENYGRVAKALIPSKAGAEAVKRPLGLELEIVPLADPYSSEATRLPVRVLFKGAPLAGATIKLYDLAEDSAPKARCLSDSDGRCTFDFQRRGSWLLNVVWATPNPEGSPTDFQTIFSSLSFGFDDPAQREGQQ